MNSLAVPALVLWLLAVGAFIRVWGLWDYAFSPDDVMNIWVAAVDSLDKVWTRIEEQTYAPLMYYVIYFLLQVSRDELVVRCLALIPGTALIGAFFFLGRRVSGTVAGLAMAYMAAFSSGAILQSQVVRSYSLMLLFSTGALWSFVSYLRTDEKKYLYGYTACMVLAILSNYPAVITLTAIGTVWLVNSIIQKKPTKEYQTIFIFNLIPFIIFSVSYLYQFSEEGRGGYLAYAQIKQTYLAPLFPHSLSGIIKNTRDFFWYLFLPPYERWFRVLAVAGLVVLWRSTMRPVAGILCLSFLLSVVLAYINRFPFGGSRHSMHLFPMAAIMAGAAIQSGYDFLHNNAIPLLAKSFSRREDTLRTPLLWLGIIAVVSSSVVITRNFKQSDFLRRTRGIHEFPLSSDNYEKVTSHLRGHMQPNDIMLTNAKTSYYLISSQLPREAVLIFPTPLCNKLVWNGSACFYLNRHYGFESMQRVIAGLQEIHQLDDFKKASTVWLVNIGWNAGEIETFIKKQPAYGLLFNKELSVAGGSIYSVKVRDIPKLLTHTG